MSSHYTAPGTDSRLYFRQVVVSLRGMIFHCARANKTWLCGACGVGDVGNTPETGMACPLCGARVEEVI